MPSIGIMKEFEPSRICKALGHDLHCTCTLPISNSKVAHLVFASSISTSLCLGIFVSIQFWVSFIFSQTVVKRANRDGDEWGNLGGTTTTSHQLPITNDYYCDYHRNHIFALSQVLQIRLFSVFKQMEKSSQKEKDKFYQATSIKTTTISQL